MLTSKRTSAALVQKYIPHYRLPLFEKLLRLSKHDWEFLCGTYPGGGKSGLEISNSVVLTTHPIHNFKIGKLIWQKDVTRWLKQRQYKVVVLELGWPIISNILLLLVAHRRRIPAIGWSKGISESAEQRPAWRRLYERVLIKGCQALIVYGGVSADYFVERGFPPEKIFVAYNTVDVLEIVKSIPVARRDARLLRLSLGLKEEVVIGYFGRLVPEKGVDKIIQAFAQAMELGLNAHLVIAGDGPQRSQLEQMARTSHASRCIRFLGRVAEEEASTYFQMFDLFVSASSAGLAVLEAMAHGKVVLLTPEVRPETELVENGVTGFITADFTIPSLAEGMLCVARDLGKVKNIGRQAQDRVLSRATLEHMVDAFDRAVDFTLKGSR